MKCIATIILEYEGKQYAIHDDVDSSLWDKNYSESMNGQALIDLKRFQWEENNYLCDCNRSLFIQEQCDPDFPELDCGDTIQLLSLTPVLVP